VTVAAWRYIIVTLPLGNKNLCTMKRARAAVGLAYVSSVILCIPSFLTFSIKQSNKPRTFLPSSSNTSTENATSDPPFVARYIVHYSKLALSKDRMLIQANFWIYRWVADAVVQCWYGFFLFFVLCSFSKKKKDWVSPI
jgi:hypothetical protein